MTYDISTNIGKVRLLIGDIDDSDLILDDDEIQYFLTTYGSDINLSAAAAALSIAAIFSREPDKKVGDLSLSGSQKAAQYLILAKQLQLKSTSGLVGWAGNQSKSERDVNIADTDKIQPFATRDCMSYDKDVNDEDDE